MVVCDYATFNFEYPDMKLSLWNGTFIFKLLCVSYRCGWLHHLLLALQNTSYNNTFLTVGKSDAYLSCTVNVHILHTSDQL